MGAVTCWGGMCQGRGREAMPVLAGTACHHSALGEALAQKRWCRGVDPVDAVGLFGSVAPQPIQGHPWPHAGMASRMGWRASRMVQGAPLGISGANTS